MRIAGIDGCPGGWIVVSTDTAFKNPRVKVTESFESACLDSAGESEVIAVDIPIGIGGDSHRRADVEAKAKLRDRHVCVFYAPDRRVLEFVQNGGPSPRKLFWRINEWSKPTLGFGISPTAVNIIPKIIEADNYMQGHRDRRVYEVHPEVSFAAMNGGGPMRLNKKGLTGRAERMKVLVRHLPADVIGIGKPRGCNPDDLYDAMAALWTASRIARGEAKRIPVEPEYDSTGLDMAIWY